MARVLCLVGALALVPVSAHGQAPVQPLADAVSYATALVNPAAAAYKAARSTDPKCQFARLAISEAIGNGAALTLKHFLVSPRPCLGCDDRGMPSGHAMNSTIGVSSQWRVGVYFAIGTAQLRTEAHRHTPWQVAAGVALGGVAELAGQKLLRCRE